MEIDENIEDPGVGQQIQLNKTDASKIVQTEYDMIKNMGFHFNYECDVNKMADLEPNDKHTILFDHISFKCNDHFGPPKPLPQNMDIDQWNEDFVKMPFSDSNVDRNGNKRWNEIQRCLNLLSNVLVEDPDSLHIENAIKQNNQRYKNTWNFNAMHTFFDKVLSNSQSKIILTELIPKIVKLALDLPNKICKPIPILKQGHSHSITLSQEQCACILANCFFCTFPSRSANNNPENMPFINFSSLYGGRSQNNLRVEKLKCIFHYFKRVTDKMPEGIITFQRQSLTNNEIPDFKKSKKTLGKVLIRSDGTIEDCIGTIQLDFANKFLGGGVLNTGCVQEEIRFMICPELLVSMLFTECLETNETVLIKGCERFSSYIGYAGSFKWSDDYLDETARDGWNRLYTHVLAMDALHYYNPQEQFKEANMCRELTKCFSGFKYINHETIMSKSSDEYPKKQAAIATGNWGCGAFNGDRQLKFLIQMMAASESDRDVIYFTFNDYKMLEKLNHLIGLISNAKLNICDIYKIILDYENIIKKAEKKNSKDFDLCQYFEEQLIEAFCANYDT